MRMMSEVVHMSEELRDLIVMREFLWSIREDLHPQIPMGWDLLQDLGSGRHHVLWRVGGAGGLQGDVGLALQGPVVADPGLQVGSYGRQGDDPDVTRDHLEDTQAYLHNGIQPPRRDLRR